MNLPTNEKIPTRDVRHFAVYKNTKLVLLVEDKPGILSSTAFNPGPPKEHPFVNAQALRAEYEHKLGSILAGSKSFDEFLLNLVKNNYDIRSYDRRGLIPELNNGYRISDGAGPVAAAWEHGGQFTTLSQQPELEHLNFEHASLTVYDSDKAGLLFELLETADTFEEFLAACQARQLTLSKL